MANKNIKKTLPNQKTEESTFAGKVIAFTDSESQVRWNWVFVFILLLLPFFIFIKVAGFQFINMDDVAIVQNNYPILSDISNIGIAFKTDAFLSLHGTFYRPLQTITFMLDAFLGKDNPWIYHVSELVYHLLTVISLYYLLVFFKLRKISAFLFSLIFSLHPLVASAVSWIPARGDVLIGLFGILLMHSFARFLQSNKKVYFILHVVLFLLAIFSKETAVLFPIILLLYYFLIADQKFDLKKLTPFGIVWLLIAILFFVLRSKVLMNAMPDSIIGIHPFIQNLPTIPILLAKFFVPVNLSTMPLFEPSFLFLGILMLVVVLIILYKSSKRKEWLPLIGFIWFLLFIIPPMFLKLFYSKYLVEYYEHRTYLPLNGLILFFAYLFNKYLTQSHSKNILWLPFVAILFITPLASIHSDDFKNSIDFFERATLLNNPGAATKLGEMYLNEKDIANASSNFEKAIDLSNNEYPPAFFDRGLINLTFVKNYKDAESDFSSTVSLDTNYVDAYINRANARILLQNTGGALADLHHAMQFRPENAEIYYTIGKAFTNSLQFETAITNFTKAISIDSNYAEAFNDRAYVNFRLNKFDSAMKDCNRAIALNQLYLNAYYNKGMIYYEERKSDSAIKEFDTTLNLANNFYFGHFYRGMAKLQKKDLKGACEDWQESVKLGFSMAQDTIKKYCK